MPGLRTMQRNRPSVWLGPRIGLIALVLAPLLCTFGCRATRFGNGYSAGGPAAPVVIQQGATAADIVAAVNNNSARIQSITATNASFAMPGLPGLPLLKGSIVLERPRNFRLRAGTTLTGEEVDLGSNNELFWLWAKQNEPPAVYFARHDQHGSGAARAMLPVDPSWVMDALGLVTLDPGASYQGPFPRPDGTLELQTLTSGPSGPMKRVTVVDPATAWVIEQHVYDPAGTLLASAVADDFRFHPGPQVSLPERVTVRVPAAELALTINVGSVSINTPIANPQQHWTLPHINGFPQVDLGRSDALPGLASPMPGQQPIPWAQQSAPIVQPAPIASPASAPTMEPATAPSSQPTYPAVAPSLPAATPSRPTMQSIPAGGVALPPGQSAGQGWRG